MTAAIYIASILVSYFIGTAMGYLMGNANYKENE